MGRRRLRSRGEEPEGSDHTKTRDQSAPSRPRLVRSTDQLLPDDVTQSSRVTQWVNSSATSLVSPTSGRLKLKYIPIDITAYQEAGEGTFLLPSSPTSPLYSESLLESSLEDTSHSTARDKSQYKLATSGQSSQSTFLRPHSIFPGEASTAASTNQARAHLQSPDAHFSGLSSLLSAVKVHSNTSISPPRLRREKRLIPPPLKPKPLRIAKAPPTFREFLEARDHRTTGGLSSKMNQSSASLSSLDQSREDPHNAPRSAPSALAQAATTASASPQVNGSGPTNLSGLVCNVHRSTGKEPPPLVGATTTVLGDKLYVFGGRVLSRHRPQLIADLYELDLVKRHWSKLDTAGDVPPPRYFHSVCALGDTMLVCYGGMTPSPSPVPTSQSQGQPPQPEPQPEVVVAADIHIYDVSKKSWTQIPSTPDAPQGRYAHCAAILPSSAAFTSADAPRSAIHHNPPSTNPHAGTLGVRLDGTGGAEMVVVGGQDSSNHYIEQISVFNLRSLRWTATSTLGRSCGAYRSVVTPLTEMPANEIGQGAGVQQNAGQDETGSPMLIYSNYNFLDVKLELQIRSPDGHLSERAMSGDVSPPGLRFPNGGVINNHFVVSGTYLTSSKQEYALWALDLRDLSWARIDAGGSVFGQGSWNRGVLWNRRNTFVILGHRKRSLVDDYNHRRINFSHLCMVELEAFGLYENPVKAAPNSLSTSISAAPVSKRLDQDQSSNAASIPLFSSAASSLGQSLLSIPEIADMDLLSLDGYRIPVNSRLLSLRWGPYFNELLAASAASTHDTWSMSDAITLRPQMSSQASRNSAITITPSVTGKSSIHTTSTLTEDKVVPNSTAFSTHTQSATRQALKSLEAGPSTDPAGALPSSRPRTLYLPHTAQTIRLLVHYLYTASLPPFSPTSLSTPADSVLHPPARAALPDLRPPRSSD